MTMLHVDFSNKDVWITDEDLLTTMDKLNTIDKAIEALSKKKLEIQEKCSHLEYKIHTIQESEQENFIKICTNCGKIIGPPSDDEILFYQKNLISENAVRIILKDE